MVNECLQMLNFDQDNSNYANNVNRKERTMTLSGSSSDSNNNYKSRNRRNRQSSRCNQTQLMDVYSVQNRNSVTISSTDLSNNNSESGSTRSNSATSASVIGIGSNRMQVTGSVNNNMCSVTTVSSVGSIRAINETRSVGESLSSSTCLRSTILPPVNNCGESGTNRVATVTATSQMRKPSPDQNPVGLASLFECPVCFDYALPPILQCQSVHIVCAQCRTKVTNCSSCRGGLDNIRNLAMEKLAASVLFPCKYSSNGCPDTLQHTSKGDHEVACEYRPYGCPCPGVSCKWAGQLDQVMQHLTVQHRSITTLQGEYIVFLATNINLPGAVDWVMMQSCFGQNSILVLEKQERIIEKVRENNYVKEKGANIRRIREEKNVRIDFPDEQGGLNVVRLTG